MKNLTTFIIPSIDRPELQRAIDSCKDQGEYLVQIDKQGIGPAATRNQLIKLAQTEWVSMLDDDDTITCDYVEKLHKEITEHPEADLVIFREYFIADLMEDDVTEDHFIWQVPEVKWGQIGIAFSVKKEIAMKYPFQDEKYEDLHFVERIQQAGYNIHFSKYLVYKGRH